MSDELSTTPPEAHDPTFSVPTEPTDVPLAPSVGGEPDPAAPPLPPAAGNDESRAEAPPAEPKPTMGAPLDQRVVYLLGIRDDLLLIGDRLSEMGMIAAAHDAKNAALKLGMVLV